MELHQKQWVQQVEKWKESGLSKSAFCRKEGINRGTFATWYRRYKERFEKPNDGFVRIHSSNAEKETGTRQNSAPIEISAGGITVRLPKDAERQLIEEVIGALEARICS